MAEPLKNHFGPGAVEGVADMIGRVYPEFDRPRFVEISLDGYQELELTQRARRIALALAETLPSDRRRALDLITDSLGPEIEERELTGMGSFIHLPLVFFIADNGLDEYETAMRAQYEVTKRFTAEFSIRAFLDRYPERTLATLRVWASDDNAHVRRLVSEGTRPRLPWAPRLRRFQEDPSPVLELLDLLKDDPEEYVRRSVANNLNDISKDHPGLVVRLARSWWTSGGEQRRRIVRHGLRSLVKQGNPDALAILGYGSESPARVARVSIDPPELALGEKVRIRVDLDNPSADTGPALVDFVVHYVKANGSTSPKVFKGGVRDIEPGGSASVSKTLSTAQMSTRTHHPGRHHVEVQLNGVISQGGWFDLLSAPRE